MLAVSYALTVTLLVIELVCARDDNDIKTRIMSATFLMVGLSTFAMSTIGVRLPIFQGPAVSYIVPLLALQTLPEWQCPNQEYLVPKDWIVEKIQQLSGSLMAGGVLHCLIGLTGLVGFIMRFVGPITIVPAIVLIGLFVYKVAVRFSETFWGIAVFYRLLNGFETPVKAKMFKPKLRQFGAPSFHVGAFISFFIATIMSVASRRVFQVIGVLYVVFSLLNKLGAFFITIPYCVLGGIQIIIAGIFIGVVLSNLQHVDLKSTRNLAIIGISLLLGLMMPYWVEQNPDGIQTGNQDVNRIIGIVLSNPVFVGGVLACFMDNTVPG
nr:hypothetical protein BaRGS_018404 [Batillaria attramentaria]